MKNKVLRKLACVCLAGIMALSALTGCGATETGTVEKNKTGAEKEQKTDSGVIEISLWHSMSGHNLDVLQELIDGYNQSQSKYVVVAENQGTYDESTGKFFSMAGGPDSADILQIGEQNLQSVIDSGLIQSVSDLMEKNGMDDSDLLDQAVNFYTVDGEMYAMPFNVSSPVIYYNAELIKNAGYDTFPATLEEIVTLADRISKESEKTKGWGFFAYGYAFEQMMTNMGYFVINNENGRSDRATEVTYQEAYAIILDWFKQMKDNGSLISYGTDSDAVLSAFVQQDIAMYLSTSALARNVINSCEFEVGISALPVPAGTEAEGVYAAGGAMCVAANRSEEVEAGVMDFLAYAVSANPQAEWAANTGYFPVCQSAYETETMKAIYTEYPQMQVAADQLLNSKVTDVTKGPLLSQLPQLRTDLATASETVINGGDIAEAIKAAAESSNGAIASANQNVQ